MLEVCCWNGPCPPSMHGPNFCRAATEAVLELQLLTTLPSGFHSSPSSTAHRSHSQLLFLWDASCLFMLLSVHYVCLSADWEMVSILTDTFHKCLKSTHTNVRKKRKFFWFWTLAICSLQLKVSREWDFPGRCTNVKCISVKVGAPNPPRAKGLI